VTDAGIVAKQAITAHNLAFALKASEKSILIVIMDKIYDEKMY
jgi:hypothetical protein